MGFIGAVALYCCVLYRNKFRSDITVDNKVCDNVALLFKITRITTS
jgi:hypothetical protein